MRRLGRRMGWLGWVLAGVLLLTAGGVAAQSASSGSTSTTQGPSAIAGNPKARALGRPGLRRGLARRVLHGELTLQTQEGTRTVVLAYGTVTALSKDAITVKSSDGVATSFAINGDTRFGFRNEPAPSAELKVGEDALVTGEKSGGTATAKRVVSGDLARHGAGAAGRATP